MEEFIFGTLATDELKLVQHRATRRGLQHMYDLCPRDPEPDSPVMITVLVGVDLTVDRVACYYTLDGSEPIGRQGAPHNGHAVLLERVGSEWDTLSWGYITKWRGTLPAQPEGTIVRYRIGAWAEGALEVFADWPEVKATTDEAAKAFFRGDPLPEMSTHGDPSRGAIFIYHVDHRKPPQWAREAVIYHIFVDRFHPGQGHDWLQTTNLRGFCGGTLWGIAEKIDYVADLGATCIWLSPIFPSPTSHGYDATDFTRVEPRLGGDEALREVVKMAHSRGIRVVLDLVCNHISNRHPIFVQARRSASNPYRDWFFFDDSEIGYRSFFGVHSMPQVNLAHPEARDWMIDTARYWLREFDVDGYRLDHANGPGPGFWTEFWAACKGEKPDSFCFGEIVEPPDILRQYIGRLDGALDFHFSDVIRRTFARRAWTEADFNRFVERHSAGFPEDFLLPTFIDNHDMDRFLYIADNDKDALRRAAAIQMRMPSPPIVYYGTEIGLSQSFSKESAIGLEASRNPMIWDGGQDKNLLAYYRGIIHERRENQPWLRSGV